jgi:EmrB/QacA subfamily drug resistance transporter
MNTQKSPAVAAADHDTSQRTSRWIVLIVLSLAQLTVILDSTIVNIALPTAQHDLKFTDAERQWVVTGYALAFGSLLLVGGRLADLFGRKRFFLVGVIGFAMASAVGGAAVGFDMLLVARVAQGAFAAVLAPAALSLVSVTFDRNAAERGRAFGIFGGVSGAGGAIGLLLGGVLTESVSWRWCLYVNVVIAAVVLVGAVIFLKDGARPARSRLDIGGTVTVALGLVGIVFGLGNSASHGWGPTTVISIAVGAALLVTFVLIERRVPHPLLPLRVILDRTRGTAYLAVGITGVGSFAVFLFLTYYLEDTLKVSPILTGVSFLPMVAAIIVGAAGSGTGLVPRFGPRSVVAFGCVLGAVGMALLTGIGPSTSYVAVILPALLVLGIGLGFVLGPAQNAATSGVSADDSGVASAMVNTAQQIGGSVGTAVFSSIAVSTSAAYLGVHGAAAQVDATVAGYHLVFWIASAVFVASAVLSFLLFRPGPLPVASNPAQS